METDKIAALDAGADDYVAKPFSAPELLARVRALLRRTPTVTSPTLQVGDLSIDTASHRVRRGSEEIVLTSKEYALLEYLARNAGRVISREEIAEHVWDEHFDRFSNLIEVYVNRLRRKVDQSDPHLIITRRNEGYMLRAEEEAATR
jgi:two-component system copper resistance phosphate regulon response regulator CusR